MEPQIRQQGLALAPVPVRVKRLAPRIRMGAAGAKEREKASVGAGMARKVIGQGLLRRAACAVIASDLGQGMSTVAL